MFVCPQHWNDFKHTGPRGSKGKKVDLHEWARKNTTYMRKTSNAPGGDAHGHGPYPITNGERALLSAWLKQGRDWLML